jgi:hypothetical protein
MSHMPPPPGLDLSFGGKKRANRQELPPVVDRQAPGKQQGRMTVLGAPKVPFFNRDRCGSQRR